MKDKKDFGKFLKAKRIEKNYSQKELADLLYVTDSAVSKWERGVAYPDITLISEICKVLDVTEHELIQSSNDIEYRKMKHEASKYIKLKKTLFWILNISYLIAVVTCLIVNLAVNHTLSWFFVVLTSLICGYSFCPTIIWISTNKKLLIFIGSTFFSFFLLFLTCSIYTSNYWFMIATMSVLILYFIQYYPILFKQQKKYLNDNYHKLSKWFVLTYVGGIFISIVLLLVAIYFYNPYNIGLGILITSCIFIIPILIGIMQLFKGGKKIMWIFIFILIGLIVISTIFGLCRGFYIRSTKVTKTYNIEDNYNNINIDVDTFDININYVESNENTVVYTENKYIKVDIKVINGTLNITRIDNRKFYDKMFSFGSLDINLYLSKDIIDSLIIDVSTGNININSGFTFNDVDIEDSTGNIDFKSNINGNLSIDNSTGHIELSNTNISGNVTLDTSTGHIKLTNVRCNKLDIEVSTGHTKLNDVIVLTDVHIEGSTGDVLFNDFDANNIDIDVSTGDIKGTILSEKFFIAESSTGKIDVPQTRNGGDCKLTTSTGNIIVQIK